MVFKCIIFKLGSNRLESFILNSQLQLLKESGIKYRFITSVSHLKKKKKTFILTYRRLERQNCTYQARIGIIQSVIQSLPLEYSKKEGVVKLARISRNKLIHTMFLKTVCICKFRKGCTIHLFFWLNNGQIQFLNTKCMPHDTRLFCIIKNTMPRIQHSNTNCNFLGA